MAGRWRMASVQMSFAIMPAAVYWFGGYTIAHGNDALSIGTIVAFTTLQTRLLFPMQSLLSVGLEVQTSMALFGRIFEYLDLPVDIVQRPDARALERGARRRAPRARLVPLRARGAVDAREIDAEIPAGTRTALVGETGSGKTTLAYLVARLYEPEQGGVSIDGVDIRDMTLQSLAATVGLVSQETYLFHASIRENLRFACPEASDEQIEAAARAAQIHELIASLPEGYDTPVGERGYRFSGGEKQRIAIARTVLRNPPVLILDEATSALDTETERAVQLALDDLAAGARRSRSRTASRRFATPTRSSCSTAGTSSSAGRTASCSSWRAVRRADRARQDRGDRGGRLLNACVGLRESGGRARADAKLLTRNRSPTRYFPCKLALLQNSQ